MYATTTPRFNFLISVILLLLTPLAHGGTVTDGDYSSTGEWGASSAQTFDFIVVGGGAAGSVVAARLVQNNFSVLLLEAGGTSSRDLGGNDYVASSFYTNAAGVLTRGVPWTRVDVPLYMNSMTGEAVYNEYNWNITNAMSGLGKTLGGSMAHNGMVWSHATQHNLQLWNVSGWSYDQFIPYVRKSENYTNSGFAPSPSLGTNGPIQIRTAGYPHPSDANFYNACIAAGYQNQPNFNNGYNVSGIGPLSFNIGNNGTSIRQTSALTYLRPLLNNPLLTIALHSQVARVLFSTTCSYSAANGQPTAVGVQFIMTVNGQQVKRTALASNEVILSSGALGSAKLLLLSGIGPRNVLNSVGITPVVVNNNVGQHIRNHLSLYVAYSGDGVVVPNEWDQPFEDLAYGTSGTGIYSDAGFATIELRMKSNASLVDPDVTMLPLSFTGDPLTKGFGVLILATEPEYALGTVTLSSSNPLDQLVYTPNLGNISSNDINTLVRAVQALRVIMNEPSAKIFGVEEAPGSSVSTAAQLRAYIQQNVGLVYHYAGSAKMGNAGDPLRVVNPALQVVGTNNLRVIDPSINAGVVYGFMQCTAVGIAEKGVAMVINQWS